MIRTDVLVIGGGPAGSACAGLLKQGGMNVIVLDKSAFPRFKPCAGWITPRVLALLGMDVHDYPFGLTEFTSFDVSLWGYKFKLPTRQYAIRRFEFDAWLLQRSGAEFHVKKRARSAWKMGCTWSTVNFRHPGWSAPAAPTARCAGRFSTSPPPQTGGR